MLKMWWLSAVDVVAQCCRCGGSVLKMWWLSAEDLVNYLKHNVAKQNLMQKLILFHIFA